MHFEFMGHDSGGTWVDVYIPRRLRFPRCVHVQRGTAETLDAFDANPVMASRRLALSLLFLSILGTGAGNTTFAAVPTDDENDAMTVRPFLFSRASLSRILLAKNSES